MNNYNEEHGVSITEQSTGEYPVLCLGEAPEQGYCEPTAGTDKAASLLAHLETEINRLHDKWQSIDAEFRTREAHIADLQKDVDAREAAIGRLTAELRCETAALEAAGERLAGKDREIEALVEDRQTRDERIAALATELADAEVAHQATLEKVAHAEAETARLNDALRREQTAAAAVGERNLELLAEQRRLRSEIQDLEIYINGRHDRWAELNSQLDDYKSGLARMEQTLKERDAVLARHDEEKERLAATIVDLERQGAEVARRLEERENAYGVLQEKLAGDREQTERLKAEYANRIEETERAIRQAADAQSRIASLELDVGHRDGSIEALNEEIERGAAALGELTTAKDDLVKRVDELEKALDERSQQTQVFREDLRMSHDQLHLAQQQVAERTTQLAASQEALDQKSRHVERLANDLSAKHKEAAGMRAEINALEARVAELGRQHGDAAAVAEQSKAEVAALKNLIASLETELRAKQATEDLLERSVERINGLRASLTALDQQMSGAADSPTAAQSALEDFVATLAADERVAAAAAAATEHPELLPMSALLDDHDRDEVIDIGRPTGNEVARKLVVTIDGEDFDYPIVSNVMTIGRSRASDIRIASHFVSRLHAKVRTNDGTTIIEDAGSKNGLLVNSERIRRRVLHHGDVVSLGGDLNLRFVEGMN